MDPKSTAASLSPGRGRSYGKGRKNAKTGSIDQIRGRKYRKSTSQDNDNDYVEANRKSRTGKYSVLP